MSHDYARSCQISPDSKEKVHHQRNESSTHYWGKWVLYSDQRAVGSGIIQKLLEQDRTLKILIACRSEQKAQLLLDQHKGKDLEFIKMDLSDPRSVMSSDLSIK